MWQVAEKASTLNLELKTENLELKIVATFD